MLEKRISRLISCLATAVALLSSASSWAKEEGEGLFREVQDLDYGVAIYDYFQQDYFGSLSELLIAEKKDSIKHHKEFARVLRGGIHLSYGMDNEASNIFHEIINDQRVAAMGASKRAGDENIARAWFYLGKLLYKKGHFADAGENLERVSKNLSKDLHPEFAFLMDAVSQRIRGDAKEFDYVPDALPVASFEPRVPAGASWSFYQRFNELLERILQHPPVASGSDEDEALDDYYPVNDGVTDDLLGDEQTAVEGEEALASVVSAPVPENEELAAMPLRKKLRHNAKVAKAMEHLASKVGASRELHETEELMSLKDKIHTTAGFLYLHLARERRAERNFRQVRGESVLVGQALLGYGWAAANNGDYKGALKPLQLLATRPMLEQTTHEAHLALPFVYEKMQAHTAALEGYDRAATVMQQELQLLASLREDLESVDPGELHKYYDRESVKWLDSARSQTAEVKKQLFVTRVLKNRLLRLMTQNQFSLMENQRQDIAWLQKTLDLWSTDLETMRFVIEARQKHAREAISAESRHAIEERAKHLAALREELIARVGAAQNSENETLKMLALSTPEQQEKHSKLLEIDERVERINNLRKQLSGQMPEIELAAAINIEKFSEQQRLLKRAQGMQVWDLSEQHSKRVWRVNKTLAKVDSSLLESDKSIAALDELVAETERQQAEYERLTMLQQQVAKKSVDAGTLANGLNRKILALLLDDVERMKGQTKVYLAQARLARARMLDNLSYDDFETLSDQDTTDAELQPVSMAGGLK